MGRLPPSDLQTHSSSIVGSPIYIPSIHALVSDRIHKSSSVEEVNGRLLGKAILGLVVGPLEPWSKGRFNGLD